MQNPVHYILEHRSNRIKAGDYAKVVLPCAGLIAIGVWGIIQAQKESAAVWFFPSVGLCLLALGLCVFFVIKVRSENRYVVLENRADQAGNFKRCNETLQKLFGDVKRFGSAKDGLVSCVVDEGKSKGKQITLISVSQKILVNVHDMSAPFSLSKSAALRKQLLAELAK